MTVVNSLYSYALPHNVHITSYNTPGSVASPYDALKGSDMAPFSMAVGQSRRLHIDAVAGRPDSAIHAVLWPVVLPACSDPQRTAVGSAMAWPACHALPCRQALTVGRQAGRQAGTTRAHKST